MLRRRRPRRWTAAAAAAHRSSSRSCSCSSWTPPPRRRRRRRSSSSQTCRRCRSSSSSGRVPCCCVPGPWERGGEERQGGAMRAGLLGGAQGDARRLAMPRRRTNRASLHNLNLFSPKHTLCRQRHSHADALDWLLMALGTVGALGAPLPLCFACGARACSLAAPRRASLTRPLPLRVSARCSCAQAYMGLCAANGQRDQPHTLPHIHIPYNKKQQRQPTAPRCRSSPSSSATSRRRLAPLSRPAPPTLLPFPPLLQPPALRRRRSRSSARRSPASRTNSCMSRPARASRARCSRRAGRTRRRARCARRRVAGAPMRC